MSINRKEFLKLALSGGASALLGLPGPLLNSWRQGGMKLRTVQRQSLVMGSVASFTVVAETEQDGYAAIRKGVEVFQEMDRIFSMYKTDSEMMRLSAQSGKEPLIISEDAQNLLAHAKQLHHATNGAFDITIEPVMRCWGFRNQGQSKVDVPTDAELQKIASLIGSDKIIIEDNAALLAKSGMAIDTGGIAGGYALDKAIEAMKKCDIAAAFINFSGDIHCFGNPPQGTGWTVQIFNPNTGHPLADPVTLHNEALSTSGAYQKRREATGGRDWGHLFKPADARPSERVASLTAIHPSAMVADAWSTAAYIGAQPPSEIKTIVIEQDN